MEVPERNGAETLDKGSVNERPGQAFPAVDGAHGELVFALQWITASVSPWPRSYWSTTS
jgi:hypothetical protein